MSTFQVGDRVRLTELGRKNLLPGWVGLAETGVVIDVQNTQYNHLVHVQRDGCKPNGYTWAGYWEHLPEPSQA